MTKREILQEQYEDSLFALLMDEMAETEGRRALEENERLKNDPSYVISAESQRKCEQTIANCFARQKARAVGRQFSRILQKAAIVAVVAVLLFTTAFAISPTFRANALNLAIEIFYDRTNLRFTKETDDVDPEGSSNNTEWLPAGYELSSYSEDSKGSWLVYSSNEGGEIIVEIYYGEGGMLSLDTEDADVQNITIQALNALLISEDGILQIVWADESAGMFVSIIGKGISEDDLIEVANNFKVT